MSASSSVFARRSPPLFALLGLGALVAGCPRVTCGEGTVEEDGVCLPVLSCGEGTHRQGDACVPDPPPDTDADGVPDEDDCDPLDPSLGEPGAWFPDADGDGYGDATSSPEVACEAPSGAVEDAADCDDANAGVHPGAEELCDGVDNDCDGGVQEGDCPVGPLPDTGVTACFDASSSIACPVAGEAFYGQDGNFDRGPLSLSDNGDGTVTDEVTGLTWMKTPVGGYTWWDAGTYCDELSLGGASDWRLPTRFEVTTVFDYSRVDPVTPELLSEYWDSSTSGGEVLWVADEEYSDSQRAFQIYPKEGYDGVNSKTGLETVRCVRGTAPQPEWSDPGDGTFVDAYTSRMWTAAADGTPRTWEEALAYCDSLDFAGHTDWYLPDIKELRSSISNTGISSALVYWSSTTSAADSARAWTTGVTIRSSYTFDKATARWYTLCARQVD